jgi:phage shock protein A
MAEPESNEPTVIDAELVEDDNNTAVEVVAPAVSGDYTEAGVPTFDFVRDRIENRIATTAGATELVGESAQAKSIDEQMAERDKAGRDKLEEIRRAMRGD